MALTFKKCCFCINLKIGCYLIGIYALLFNATTAAVQSTNQLSPSSKVSFSSFCLLMIITLINIGFNIVFLYALKKDRKGLVWITMMYRIMSLVFEALGTILYALVSTALVVALFLVSTLFSLYCVLVIMSYYLTMPDQPSESAPAPNT